MEVLLYLILITVIAVPVAFLLSWRLKARYSKKIGKKALKVIDAESPYRQKKIDARKTDEMRSKQKNKEKEKEELETGVRVYDPHGLEAERNIEEVEIVGLAEPKGFWSNFIRSQKLRYILNRLSAQNKGNKGFWVNLIKAQAASKGKESARGR